MSFKEKMHWTSFITIALGFGYYYVNLAIYGHTVGPTFYFGLIAMAIGFFIAATIVAATVFAILNPKDANASTDERDRNFHRRALPVPYYILVVGAWCVGGLFHAFGPYVAMNALMGLLVSVELIRIGTQLFFYRRGY